MDETSESCVLCGNVDYEKGKACEVCQAKPTSILVNGGYLYPAESGLFRRLMYGLIGIVIAGIAAGSGLAYWLMNP